MKQCKFCDENEIYYTAHVSYCKGEVLPMPYGLAVMGDRGVLYQIETNFCPYCGKPINKPEEI